MRYGLLVFFVLCVGNVQAQQVCNGPKCAYMPTQSVSVVSQGQSVVSQRVTAPRILNQKVTQTVGPIRQAIRNVFRR